MAQESRNTEEMEMGCHERPVPCANNCGFFGNRATMDLCSKCYTGVAMATSAAANPHCPSSSLSSSSVRVVEITAGAAVAGHGEAVPVLVASTPATVAPPTAVAPTRCFSCRKRVGLTGFKCRCGDIFCSTHRYSDRHDCNFDYQAMARASIAKANPLVVASKMNKI